MKHVLRMLFLRNTLIHDLFDGLETKLSSLAFSHEATVDELLLVQEFFLTRQILERLGDSLVSITNDYDDHVVLGELRLGVEFQAVEVVDHT